MHACERLTLIAPVVAHIFSSIEWNVDDSL